MSVFTEAELDLLRAPGVLGRLGTVGPDGGPQVRPVGFVLDPDTGVFDVPGMANPTTQKWRNVERDPRVSLVIDDTGPNPDAFEPRVVEIRGVAEVLPDERAAGAFVGAAPGVIRVHPRRILSYTADGQNNRRLGG